MRALLGLVAVLSAYDARAQGVSVPKLVEDVQEAVEQARRLHRSLGSILEVAYALSTTDPDELGRLPSVIYGAILDEIRRDPALAALLDNTLEQYRGGFVRVAALAGATADVSVPGALTTSLDLSWELPLCRVLGAHGQGYTGYQDGSTISSYALGGTACLPLPANTVQVTYTRRSNVRSSLLRRPVVQTDRREEHVVNVLLRFWRWNGKHHKIDVSPFVIDVVATRSEDNPDAIAGQTGSVSVAPVDWRRKGKGLAGGDMTLRFVQVKAFFHQDEPGIGGRYTSTTAISPLVLDGIGIGDHVALGLDLGYGVGGVYDPDDLPAMPDPSAPPPPALVRRRLAHFEAWADFAESPADPQSATLTGQLKVGHTLVPAYGGQMILEDRATARGEVILPFLAARGEAFLGRARVVRIDDDAFATVYGGAVDAAYEIIPNVHAIGRFEVAQAIAAGVDTEPLRLQREVRATIGVTAHLDRRW